MGVSILVGIADGTSPAAALYSRSSGDMIGSIFESQDCYEQAESFLQWVLMHGPMRAVENHELDLVSSDLPDPRLDTTDVRAWPDHGLAKLRKHWQKEFIDHETGLLKETAHAAS